MSETITPTPAAPSSGTAGGRGGGQGRGQSGRGRGYRGNRTTSTSTTAAHVHLQSNTEEMNGHVFQRFNESDNKKQFSKMVEAVGEYIAKKLKYPGDMDSLTKDLVLPTIPEPEELDPEETNLLVKAIWNKKVTSYCTRTDYLKSNFKTAYAVIWGQCSEAMKTKLTSFNDFKTNDCIWILKEIKGITYGFEGQPYIFLSLDNARTNYYAYTQGPDDTIAIYLNLPRLRADCPRFGDLWLDLENQFTRGNDHYPIDLTAVYSLLVNFKSPVQEAPVRRNIPRNPEFSLATSDEDGMLFVQAGEIIAGFDGITRDTVLCFHCQHNGHYANKCPSGANAANSDAVQLLQANHRTNTPVADAVSPSNELSKFTFAHLTKRYELIPSSWVLLDSQSTVMVFKNPTFLSNIRRSSNQLKVYTNGGTQVSSFIGNIKNFGTVWYNPNSLANIFSLAAVRKLCRIAMDTNVEPALCVHRTDGSVMKFSEYKNGLYYHDAAVAAPKTNVAPVIDYSFVTTVEVFYTSRN